MLFFVFYKIKRRKKKINRKRCKNKYNYEKTCDEKSLKTNVNSSIIRKQNTKEGEGIK